MASTTGEVPDTWGPRPVQEPAGLDRGHVEEPEQDGGGHDDAPLVVHPGAVAGSGREHPAMAGMPSSPKRSRRTSDDPVGRSERRFLSPVILPPPGIW